MSALKVWRDRLFHGLVASIVTMGLLLNSQPTMAQTEVQTRITGKPGVTLVKPAAISKARRALIAKQLEWHRALINTPLPRGGCYKAQYPDLKLQEVPCVKPLNIPMPPRHGPLPLTVGNGNDYSAQVSGHLISVVGSFDTVSTTGEKGLTYFSSTEVADAYTLQLNTNTFNSPPACAGAANPATCQGWQQYVYSSKTLGEASIQYWLVGYGTSCPTGWIQSSNDCYRNSDSGVTVDPVIPVTALEQTSLTGSVTAGGDDRLDLASGGVHYVVTSPDNILSLANYWNTAEFTVVGDCCYFSANFDPNTTIAVRATVHDGTTNAPICVLQGFTGETNNLNLSPTPAIGVQSSPVLISNQISDVIMPASCAVAAGVGDIHIHTFTPTPKVSAPVSNLNYDFQAEGDFVMAKTDDGFEVQARQISGAPMWPNASVNQAIAARIGKSIVVLSAANNNPQLIINGSPISLGNGERRILPDDGDVTRHNNTYVARDMWGNSVQVMVQSAPKYYLDVYVGLGRWPTNVQGLLANAKDNLNAVMTRTGTIIPAPFNFSTFYRVYGDSWRVKENQSLFKAASTHLPQLRVSNPKQPFDASNLAKTTYLAAKAQCQRVGVKGQALDDCILDVAVIGDKKAALLYMPSRIHPQLSVAKRAILFESGGVLPVGSINKMQ